MRIEWQITLFKYLLCATYKSQLYHTSSRLCSPNLKDVVGLEDAQWIFNFLYICVQLFSRDPRLPSQIYTQMYGKLEKLTERLLAKLHLSDLANRIFYIVV